MDLPPPFRRVNPRGALDLVVDADQTLLHAVPGSQPVPPSLETLALGQERAAVLRPFARQFLALAGDRCRTLTLWTNGAPEWARAVSMRVFPTVRWFAVLDRRHSVRTEHGHEKRLARLRARADYPMTEGSVILMDDSGLAATVNPGACLTVPPFEGQDPGDRVLLNVALGLGWVRALAPPRLPPSTRAIIDKRTPLAFDPLPFGMTNQKSMCYFNALVQCMLRVPTLMASEEFVRGQTLESWQATVRAVMPEGEQDSSEAFIRMVPDGVVTTPTMQLRDAAAPAPAPSAPALMVHLSAEARCVQTGLDALFDWHHAADEGRRPQVMRMVFPPDTTCLVVVLHRNAGRRSKDARSVFPQETIACPDGAAMRLCGAVLHTGSVNYGHYFAVFGHHTGDWWVANDTSVVRTELAHAQHRAALLGSILFYDRSA